MNRYGLLQPGQQADRLAKMGLQIFELSLLRGRRGLRRHAGDLAGKRRDMLPGLADLLIERGEHEILLGLKLLCPELEELGGQGVRPAYRLAARRRTDREGKGPVGEGCD